jgi:hypothetical protein
MDVMDAGMENAFTPRCSSRGDGRPLPGSKELPRALLQQMMQDLLTRARRQQEPDQDSASA